MLVYRICLAKWSGSLTASGSPARWNSRGKFVIYTAGSRALACLENVVHRSGEGLQHAFKVMVIEIPEGLTCREINPDDLPEEWFSFQNYAECQQIGDRWLKVQDTPILKVPSAIIQQEFNFLINPHHQEFSRIRLRTVENFDFDPRIID